MQCQQCQHINRAGVRFCGACGQTLTVQCGACGNANSPVNRFCDGCGHTLAAVANAQALDPTPRGYTPQHLAQKILTSRSALEGERKQVTVLFCDMANSTELAQRIGAESMHALLNHFFELALSEVHRVEGTVNQFLGDGFMALFGAPVAHEDHVRRALLAASGIRQRLKEASADDSLSLSQVRVRMGLNTGVVVVGKIGDNLRMDYTAVGDTTNIAARLQALAKPGQIHCSESVHAAGQRYFDFVALGKHELKGIKAPVEVYELNRALLREESESRAKRLDVGSPLVGRDRELALLSDELRALVGGRGGALVLAGEPGSGKSRLVVEARRQLRAGNLLWLEGRAVSFGRSLSYLPFIEILKSCFEIEDDDAEDDVWRKLNKGLTALFADRTPEMLPYIATVLASRIPPEYLDRVRYLDGPGLRRQVFLCMRQLFEQLAQRQPVVLILEDWHWADQSSIELAEHLWPLAGTTAFLVFFTTRTDPEGRLIRIRQFASGQASSTFQEIMLEPLSEELSAVLVSNLVGTLEMPLALRDQILRRTEGNPFFIEEVIRSLVTDGVLARDGWDQSWKMVKQVNQVSLPDTIQGLILARIDRLDEDRKQALKLASVIGRSFFIRVLSTIGAAQHNLQGSLVELEHAELIRQGQQVPELEYIFKHALVQEAAYSSILVEQRRAIHGRVAQAIETLFADHLDEFTSLLAYHYTRAEDWQKAQEYLFKAGDQAGRMAADAEALEHFREAQTAYLKAFGDKLSPLQRAALARKVGTALYSSGQYEQALGQFRRALSQFGLNYPRTSGGVRRAILAQFAAHFMRRLRAHLGWPKVRKIDHESAQEMSTICHAMSWMDYFVNKERMLLDCLLQLHVGENSTYVDGEVLGLSSIAFGFMTFDLRAMSRRYHHRASALAQQTGNPSTIAFAVHALGFLDFYDGRWDQAEANFSLSAKTYREAGDIHRCGGAKLMHSIVIDLRGGVARNLELANEVARDGTDSADPQLTSWSYQIRGYAELACGPLDKTVAHLREGVALAAKIPAWDNFNFQMSLLGKGLVLQGKQDEALLVYQEALRVMEAQNLKLAFDQVEVFTGLASCHLALVEGQQGQARANALRAALASSTKALKLARRQPAWLAQALRLAGTAQWFSGQEDLAKRHWHESLALSQQAGFVRERAKTLFEMGQRTADQNLVAQSAEVFSQTGAKVSLAFSLSALARLHGQSNSDIKATLEHCTHAIAALQAVDAHAELAIARTQHEQLKSLLREPMTTDRLVA